MWENDSSLKRKFAKNSCNLLHLSAFFCILLKTERLVHEAQASHKHLAKPEKCEDKFISIRTTMSEVDIVMKLVSLVWHIMAVWPRYV